MARLPVDVIFFEHLSSVEQVEFFWRTDIVLSGHAAQLTGIPFMKTANMTGHCKQVLELFPFDYVLSKGRAGYDLQDRVISVYEPG